MSTEQTAEFDEFERPLRAVSVAALDEAVRAIEEYAERRSRTAHQTWFNPIAGARAQGRVSGLDQAADIVRAMADDLRLPPGEQAPR